LVIPSVLLDALVLRAISEDIGRGDVTTAAVVGKDVVSKGIFVAKEEFVLAGLFVAKRVFELIDSEVNFEEKRKDGDEIKKGEVIAEVSGSSSSLLSGERVALNFLQHMSGIATLTMKAVELVKDYQVTVLDTRKTTPGLRILEKYAVRVGGGKNHRFGLDDGVLIKNNHIKIAGGVREAVLRVRKIIPHLLKIEVEVRNISEIREAIEAGVDIVMLDNMSPDEVREAIKIAEGKTKIEISGRVNLDNIKDYASLGVNYISMGILTHSAKSVDISFLIK
jgi:nicotinate-nucleotide pyrophosphorylase (carboxylating)